MNETTRKKKPPPPEKKPPRLGYLVWAFFLAVFFVGFFSAAPRVDQFCSERGMETWLGLAIFFFVWIFVIVGIAFVTVNLDGRRLLVER